ncbi:prepilin peptidase [Hyphomicrobium sp. CS1GBMeth3]|uniref:A24 family peptidase n=1 Tax=Hyphomicrobium sp. CS1GBMeth3 TaxID=1892845 RepID=UPI000930B28F|nr:prepilin peptidase [Hyphomicrobium sp. CS1GBMeth3]
MFVIASTILMAFAAVMAFAAAMDLLTMTIPNRVTLGLMLAFFAAAPLMGLGASDIMMHIAAGAVVLAAGIALFAVGGFGGGDAKLLAVGALWIGFDQLLAFLTLTAVCGGLLALAILYYRKLPVLGIRAPDWAMRLHRQGGGIPYGIAIAAAALFVFPITPWVVASVG